MRPPQYTSWASVKTAIETLDTDFAAMRQQWTASIESVPTLGLDLAAVDANNDQLQAHADLLSKITSLEDQASKRRVLAQALATSLDMLNSTNMEELRQRPLDSSTQSQRSVRGRLPCLAISMLQFEYR